MSTTCRVCGANGALTRNLCADCAKTELHSLLERAAIRKTQMLAARAYRRGMVSARFALALRHALQVLEHCQ